MCGTCASRKRVAGLDGTHSESNTRGLKWKPGSRVGAKGLFTRRLSLRCSSCSLTYSAMTAVPPVDYMAFARTAPFNDDTTVMSQTVGRASGDFDGPGGSMRKSADRLSVPGTRNGASRTQ